MGYLADIYVIKRTRLKKSGIDFLNEFLPNRQESSDEYLIPQYADNPVFEFDTADELMIFLESNHVYSQNIYWKNTVEKAVNKHGMIFYTKDGCMVYGISINAEINGNPNTENINECLAQMKAFFKTNIGYIDYENPPANTYDEFVGLVKSLK